MAVMLAQLPAEHLATLACMLCCHGRMGLILVWQSSCCAGPSLFNFHLQFPNVLSKVVSVLLCDMDDAKVPDSVQDDLVTGLWAAPWGASGVRVGRPA